MTFVRNCQIKPLTFFEDVVVTPKERAVSDREVAEARRSAEEAGPYVAALLAQAREVGGPQIEMFKGFSEDQLVELFTMFLYAAIDTRAAPWILGSFASSQKIKLLDVIGANAISAMRVWTAYLIAYPETKNKENRWWTKNPVRAAIAHVYSTTAEELKDE